MWPDAAASDRGDPGIGRGVTVRVISETEYNGLTNILDQRDDDEHIPRTGRVTQYDRQDGTHERRTVAF